MIALFRLVFALLLVLPAVASAADGERLVVPDEWLVDQDGKRVHLPALVKGKTVAFNFAFSTCSTVCSPMTATFAKLQQDLGERLDRDVRLVTISLDPRTDTPERLDAWAKKFGRRQGWTFLTGSSEVVKRTLEALGGWVSVKEDHSPLVLVGHAASGRWKRVRGLTSAAVLREAIDSVTPAQAEAAIDADKAAREWFTDTQLVDQFGKSHRFYTDLIRGKKVLINFGFAACETACSPITANLARVQRLLGKRVGEDVRMITITVDPARDTPERLRTFSQKFGIGPGWYFLSGSREEVEAVLRKLGGYTDVPANHSTAVLIGDSVSGHWVKAVAMSPPENLVAAVEGIDD